jgi:hypothetical protein
MNSAVKTKLHIFLSRKNIRGEFAPPPAAKHAYEASIVFTQTICTG